MTGNGIWWLKADCRVGCQNFHAYLYTGEELLLGGVGVYNEWERQLGVMSPDAVVLALALVTGLSDDTFSCAFVEAEVEVEGEFGGDGRGGLDENDVPGGESKVHSGGLG